VRELSEETGLKCKEYSLFKVPHLWHADIEQKDGVKRFSFTVFVCRDCVGQIAESEKTVPEWVDIDIIGKLKLLANTHDAVKRGQELFQKL
jgi:8-oxo-dGTP pyrophosphatase MutT (NUDIX family)